MIWIAGISLVIGVLVLILIPLFTRGNEQGLSAALKEQKLRIADDLAEIGRLRASGELTEEDAAARQRALETEARSTFEAERQAKDIAQPRENRVLVRGLVAALAFILIGNVTAGVYLYKGGWKELVFGMVGGEGHSGGGGGGGGGQAAQGGGENADPAAMVARLEKRLQDNPNDPKGQALLGRSYIVQERFADAAAAYGKAVELEPENLESRLGLGVATIRLGNPQQAAKIFSDILKINPDHQFALWYTGMLQVHRKDIEGAKKTYKHLMDTTPEEEKAQMQSDIDKVLENLNNPQGMGAAE